MGCKTRRPKVAQFIAGQPWSCIPLQNHYPFYRIHLCIYPSFVRKWIPGCKSRLYSLPYVGRMSRYSTSCELVSIWWARVMVFPLCYWNKHISKEDFNWLLDVFDGPQEGLKTPLFCGGGGGFFLHLMFLWKFQNYFTMSLSLECSAMNKAQRTLVNKNKNNTYNTQKVNHCKAVLVVIIVYTVYIYIYIYMSINNIYTRRE